RRPLRSVSAHHQSILTWSVLTRVLTSGVTRLSFTPLAVEYCFFLFAEIGFLGFPLVSTEWTRPREAYGISVFSRCHLLPRLGVGRLGSLPCGVSRFALILHPRYAERRLAVDPFLSRWIRIAVSAGRGFHGARRNSQRSRGRFRFLLRKPHLPILGAAFRVTALRLSRTPLRVVIRSIYRGNYGKHANTRFHPFEPVLSFFRYLAVLLFSGSQRHTGPNGLSVTTLRRPSTTVPGAEVSPCWHARTPRPMSTPGTPSTFGCGACGALLRLSCWFAGAAAGGVRSTSSDSRLVTRFPSHSSTISSLFSATNVNSPIFSPGR